MCNWNNKNNQIKVCHSDYRAYTRTMMHAIFIMIIIFDILCNCMFTFNSFISVKVELWIYQKPVVLPSSIPIVFCLAVICLQSLLLNTNVLIVPETNNDIKLSIRTAIISSLNWPNIPWLLHYSCSCNQCAQ